MTALQTLPAGRYRDTARRRATEYLRVMAGHELPRLERPEVYRRVARRTASHVYGLWASIAPRPVGIATHVYLDLYATTVGDQLAAMVLARRARRAA